MVLVCQNPDSTKTKRFSIGLVFSPDYCYRTLKPDGASMSQSIARQRDSTETGRTGFTTGLSFLFQMNKRFTLETGIQYSDKGEQTKDMVLNFGSNIAPRNGFAYSGGSGASNPVSANFVYHYNYIDIPLKANYYLLTRRFKLFASAGLSVNVFLNERNNLVEKYSDGSSSSSSSTSSNGLSRINLAFVAGLGVSYSISNRLTIRMEPVYRRSITSIIDAPVKEYVYSIGLNTGLYYGF